MKRLAIIIPVKPLGEGKSRLDGILAPSERYDLNTKLLRNTFDRAAELHDLAQTYVVSRSSTVISEARKRGFAYCAEPPDFGLNAAVDLGTKAAQADGAAEIMVLPVDLPWLSSVRLRHFVGEVNDACDVIVVTDRERDGTNLLLWRPIHTSVFHYGKGSASLHARAALRLGLRATVCQDAALSFDLDTPGDYELWSQGVAPERAWLRVGS